MHRVPVRYVQAVLLFAASFVHYFARININMTIITMTENADMICPARGATLSSEADTSGPGEIFCWTEVQKSLVKGAFFYGYAVLQVPGGWLSEVYGTKLVLAVATVANALLTLISPALSRFSVWALIGARVLIGLAQGVLFPSMNPMIMRWAPQQEQSKFYAFSTMGGTFGTIFIYPICGFILKRFSWETVFYVTGGFCLTWCIVWHFLASDDPTESRIISVAERGFILKNRPSLDRGSDKVNLKLSLLWSILESPAIKALMFCSFANDWGLYTLLTEGPNFISSVLHKDIVSIGVLSSLAYLGRFCCAQLSAAVADFLLDGQIMTKSSVRKVMFAVAYLSPAAGLLLMGWMTNNWVACIVVMTVGFSLNGFNVAAFVNILDVAPEFSGTVMGLANGFSATAGFLVPSVTDALIRGEPSDPGRWRILFLLGAILYVAGVVTFAMFGRVEPEPFNKLATEGDQDGEKQQVEVDTLDLDRQPLILT